MKYFHIIVYCFLWVFLLLMGAAACAPQHLTQQDIRPLPLSVGNTTHIEGIRQGLSRSPEAPVRVLLLHGMIAHEPNYSAALQRRLMAELHFRLVRKDSSVIERGYKPVVFSGPQPTLQDSLSKSARTVQLLPSQIRRTSWTDPAHPSKERVVFYEILWAPFRDQVKQHLFSDFEIGRPSASDGGALVSSGRRVAINKTIKNNLLVGGFSDASIVLGPVGDVLRDDVALALSLIANDALRPSDESFPGFPPGRCRIGALPTEGPVSTINQRLEAVPFFAITHSLGSFLLMDTHERSVSEKPLSAYDSVRKERLSCLLANASIFMRANQVALLRLGQLTAHCNPTNSADPCPNPALRRIPSRLALPQLTRYVAFNDVDDLLGYELPPYLQTVGFCGTLVNVTVRNPGLRIPGLFKSPMAAHSNSEKNPAVLRAILDGVNLPPTPLAPH